MTAREDTALGERIAVLETLLKSMAEGQKDRDAKIAKMADEIEGLTRMLEQAKGARWAIVGLVGIAGTAGALISKYLPLLSGMPR